MIASTHTVRPGENLSAIAKRYQLPGWQSLYFADINAQFRLANPDPDLIRPGSLISIPPNRTELRQQLQARLVRLKDLRVEVDVMFREQEQTLRGDLRNVKSTANRVDTTATIVTLLTSLTQLSIKAAGIVKLEGESLKQANRKFAKDFAVDRAKNMRDLTAQSFAAAKAETTSMSWILAKTIAQSWCDMTSPSFWANTFVNYFQEGKSWSESVTTKPEDVFEQSLNKLQGVRSNVLADIDKKMRELQAELSAI